jgi:hypothetical protein
MPNTIEALQLADILSGNNEEAQQYETYCATVAASESSFSELIHKYTEMLVTAS